MRDARHTGEGQADDVDAVPGTLGLHHEAHLLVDAGQLEQPVRVGGHEWSALGADAHRPGVRAVRVGARRDQRCGERGEALGQQGAEQGGRRVGQPDVVAQVQGERRVRVERQRLHPVGGELGRAPGPGVQPRVHPVGEPGEPGPVLRVVEGVERLAGRAVQVHLPGGDVVRRRRRAEHLGAHAGDPAVLAVDLPGPLRRHVPPLEVGQLGQGRGHERRHAVRVPVATARHVTRRRPGPRVRAHAPASCRSSASARRSGAATGLARRPA